jgi:hypothetical protein
MKNIALSYLIESSLISNYELHSKQQCSDTIKSKASTQPVKDKPIGF